MALARDRRAGPQTLDRPRRRRLPAWTSRRATGDVRAPAQSAPPVARGAIWHLVWCQNGAILAHMKLAMYVEALHDQLVVAAESGGPESQSHRRAARPRAGGGDARRPARGALRRGRRDHEGAGAGGGGGPPPRQRPRLRRDPAGLRSRATSPTSERAAVPHRLPAGDDEGGTSRLNLRLPEGLKARIEETARPRGPVAQRLARPRRGRRRRRHAGAEVTAQPGRKPAATPDGSVDHHGPLSAKRIRSAPMPTFETNQPIVLSIEMSQGAVHVIASDRTDTVVAVEPERSGPPRRRRGGRNDRRRPGQRDLVHQVAEGSGHRGTVRRLEAERLRRRHRGAPGAVVAARRRRLAPTSVATAVSMTSR